MKKYLLIFSILVLVGAGCLGASDTQDEMPKEDLKEVQDEVQSSDTATIEVKEVLTGLDKIRVIFANREAIEPYINGTYSDMELCNDGACATYKADLKNGELIKVYAVDGGLIADVEVSNWEIKIYDATAYLEAFDEWYATQ